MGDPQRSYPGHPRHRHERQGFDGSDVALRSCGHEGISTGHVHEPTPRAHQRADVRRRRADQRRDWPSQLAALAELEALPRARPTWFELVTAAAYRWFADEAVEAAVIEVGLGGRWDATNVADGDVAVITNVELDHVEILGGPGRR